MTIYFGTDHAGFELKEKLVMYVRDVLGYEVTDCGALAFDAEDDYPALIRTAVVPVADAPHERRAIILGGSGTGEAIVANRFSGIRAVTYYGGPLDIVALSRSHNDANVLSLGARFVTESEAREAIALWLTTPFTQDERHVRRIIDIDAHAKTS